MAGSTKQNARTESVALRLSEAEKEQGGPACECRHGCKGEFGKRPQENSNRKGVRYVLTSS